MAFKRGYDGKWYVVYPSSESRERHAWFWLSVLRRRVSCFAGYDNAYQLG
jgi:hypothetical protein